MEALKTALFEDPLGIYLALAVIAALGLVSYQTWRTVKSAWPTAVALVVGAAVFAVSTLVVTQREQIRAACDEIAKAVTSRNTVVLEFFLDKDFAGWQEAQTRKKAVRWVARNLEQYRVTGVELKILELNVRDDLATMLVRSDITSETFGAMRLNWRVVWIKRSGGWLIYRVSKPTTGPAAAEDEEGPT